MLRVLFCLISSVISFVYTRNLANNPYNEVTLVPISARPLSEQSALWRIGGNAVVTDNGILLTSQESVQQRGGIVGIQPLKYLGQHWRIDLTVRIYGDRFNLFGDGIALWLTRTPSLPPLSTTDPHVLGGPTVWEGMGIFLDTFDNNIEQSGVTYPYISLLMNDKRLVVDRDPAAAVSPINLPAGCTASILRKNPENLLSENGPEPSYFTLRIEYNRADGNNLFTASYLVSNNGQDYLSRNDWQHCFQTSNINIPSGYYLSVTSSTGDMTSDNHFVHNILVHAEEGATEDMVPNDIRDEWNDHYNRMVSVTKSLQEAYLAPSPSPPPVPVLSDNNNDNNNNANNDHSGDDPNAPPHQHEAADASVPVAQTTDNNNDNQQQPSSQSFDSSNNNPSSIPFNTGSPENIPRSEDLNNQNNLPPTPPAPVECPPVNNNVNIDFETLNAVVKENPMVQFVRTRVQSTASRLDGVQRNIGTKIEESNARLQSLLDRMQVTEANLDSRLANVERELKEALEQLKNSSMDKSTQWILPFSILGLFIVGLTGAWFFNYNKVKKY